jgi:hypothetical protein
MKMRAYLYEPADRPDYRGARSHAQFVANLPLSPQTVKARIARRFGFTDRRLEAAGHEQADAAALAEAKYGDPAWTFRR